MFFSACLVSLAITYTLAGPMPTNKENFVERAVPKADHISACEAAPNCESTQMTGEESAFDSKTAWNPARPITTNEWADASHIHTSPLATPPNTGDFPWRSLGSMRQYWSLRLKLTMDSTRDVRNAKRFRRDGPNPLHHRTGHYPPTITTNSSRPSRPLSLGLMLSAGLKASRSIVAISTNAMPDLKMLQPTKSLTVRLEAAMSRNPQTS